MAAIKMIFRWQLPTWVLDPRRTAQYAGINLEFENHSHMGSVALLVAPVRVETPLARPERRIRV